MTNIEAVGVALLPKHDDPTWDDRCWRAVRWISENSAEIMQARCRQAQIDLTARDARLTFESAENYCREHDLFSCWFAH